MKHRPWPIVLCSILYLLAPIGTLIYAAHLMDVEPLWLAKYRLFNSSYYEFVAQWLVLPMAGVALYLMKPWSYILFGSVTVWSLAVNQYNFIEYPEFFGTGSLALAYVFTFAMVVYFTQRNVRLGFFDRRVRWWETPKRYRLDLPATVHIGDKEHQTQIKNVSTGGLLLFSTDEAQNNSEVDVEFRFLNVYFNVHGVIRHTAKTSNGDILIGVEFQDLKREMQKRVTRLNRALRALDFDDNESFKNRFSEFLGWAKLAVTTGQGIIPQIPSHSFDPSRPKLDDEQNSKERFDQSA